MQALFLMIIGIYALAAVFFAIKNDWSTIVFFLAAVLLQNLIAIVFCAYVPSMYISLFSLVKEVMLYLAVIVAFVRKGRVNLSCRSNQLMLVLLAVYCVMLVKNLLSTSVGLYAAIVSLRYLLLPLLCIYVGMNLTISPRRLDTLLKTIVGFSCLLAVTALIEYFFLGDEFWSSIGYTYYAEAIKGNGGWTLVNGVTVNFYTWDFGPMIRRLVGITADPLATAYLIFLGAAIVVTGCVRERSTGKINKFWFCALLCGICALAVFSKAIYVLVLVLPVMIAYFNKWFPRWFMKAAIVVGGVAAAGVLMLYLRHSETVTSAIVHITGLLKGFAAMGLTGHGLGTAGVQAAMLAGETVAAAESFVGSMAVQVGLLGVGAFAAYLLVLFVRLIRIWNRYHSRFTLFALALLPGLVLCMMFSESSVSVMGTGIYFILMGLAARDDVYGTCPVAVPQQIDGGKLI